MERGRGGSILLDLLGKQDFGNLGVAVSSARDLDGDGRDEIAVGGSDVDFPWVTHTGQVVVLTVKPPHLTLGLEDGVPVASRRARGLRPDEDTWLFHSRHGYGEAVAPGLGVLLDLRGPAHGSGPRRSDALGNLDWPVAIPAKAHGVAVWLQMARVGLKTNVTGGVPFL